MLHRFSLNCCCLAVGFPSSFPLWSVAWLWTDGWGRGGRVVHKHFAQNWIWIQCSQRWQETTKWQDADPCEEMPHEALVFSTWLFDMPLMEVDEGLASLALSLLSIRPYLLTRLFLSAISIGNAGLFYSATKFLCLFIWSSNVGAGSEMVSVFGNLMFQLQVAVGIRSATVPKHSLDSVLWCWLSHEMMLKTFSYWLTVGKMGFCFLVQVVG